MSTRSKKRWSQEVTEKSDALDLDKDVFTWKNPKRIAASLKRSAEHSKRRKSGAFRSAMSMLTSISTAGAKTCPGRRNTCWSAPRMRCGRNSAAPAKRTRT
jgi:hypothetical protein